jgi:hypothetical protein
LLAVDELSRASAGNYSPAEMLSVLTADHLDQSESLFLSVAAYGAIDLNKFSTGSNRTLLLQTLSPIWHAGGFDPQTIHLLPKILQPFFDIHQRRHLPYQQEHLKLYSTVSTWIKISWGHPRRMECLFKALESFDLAGVTSIINNTEEGGLFYQKLKEWIDENDNVELAIENGSPPADFGGLVEADFECLAKDTACSFKLSSDEDIHKISRRGSAKGFCQFLNNANISNIVKAFIPLGVLEHLISPALSLDPCGKALFMLKDALTKYSGVVFLKGKALELVLMSSLLLYSRSNLEFSPRIFCNSYHCSSELKEISLLGGAVEIVVVERFPKCVFPNLKAVSPNDISELVRKLKHPRIIFIEPAPSLSLHCRFASSSNSLELKRI